MIKYLKDGSKKLSDMTKKIILDLGCGLKPHERANIVVDINPIINELGENIKKIVHDLNKIPYPFADDSVDEIHCYCLLEHLQIHSFDFFRECCRILKPDGKLFLKLPNAFHYRTRIRFLLGKFIVDSSFHPFHIKLLKPSYLITHLRYLGFDVKLNPTTMFWRKVGLEKFFPNIFARGIDIEARKRR
jgi:predicted SAM-dependent methyltransferase